MSDQWSHFFSGDKNMHLSLLLSCGGVCMLLLLHATTSCIAACLHFVSLFFYLCKSVCTSPAPSTPMCLRPEMWNAHAQLENGFHHGRSLLYTVYLFLHTPIPNILRHIMPGSGSAKKFKNKARDSSSSPPPPHTLYVYRKTSSAGCV